MDTFAGHFCDPRTRRIAAAKFKQQCLALLDSVDPEGIVITKHGRPVARLVPFQQSTADLIGSMKGKIHIKKDILTTGLVWHAES